MLRKPIHLQKNFRACVKIYPSSYNRRAFADEGGDRRNTATTTTTPTPPDGRRTKPASSGNNKMTRIFLEAPKRLIALFDDDDEVIVKCFRSINEQVALYVEAEGRFSLNFAE